MPVLINDDKLSLLNCTRLPARLTSGQTAAVLGFEDHNIPVLAKARLLQPLGKPPQNAVKFYASSEVLKLAQDPSWLAKATNAIYGSWKAQNSSRRSKNRETDLEVLEAVA